MMPNKTPIPTTPLPAIPLVDIGNNGPVALFESELARADEIVRLGREQYGPAGPYCSRPRRTISSARASSLSKRATGPLLPISTKGIAGSGVVGIGVLFGIIGDCRNLFGGSLTVF